MLNRRYLRVKVMQALYAFVQSDGKDLNKHEKELLQSIDKIYDLYIYLITLIVEIRDQAQRIAEDSKSKRLPTANDLNPNTRFIDNRLIHLLANSVEIKREAEQRKVNWVDQGELIRKILNNIKADEDYTKYMDEPNPSFESDKNFVIDFYKQHIAEFEPLEDFFEERSIYWLDDMRLVNSVIIKFFERFNEHTPAVFPLLTLYKDEEEDRQFVIDLFRKTIIHDKENEKLIADKTKNWEVERIALMDILLMKMAITEIKNFPSIPVKVSLNEYIDLSKLYSSPKSKMFINGILDKLVLDFKERNELNKAGRGLME